MKKIILFYGTIIFVLGIVALSIQSTLNIPITYVHYNNTYKMYIYDFPGYLNGLRVTLKQIFGTKLLEWPTEPDYNWSTVEKAVKSAANTILFGINVAVILGINMIWVVAKLFWYVQMVVLSILGLNSRSFWLYDISTRLYNTNIPYIPYV